MRASIIVIVPLVGACGVERITGDEGGGACVPEPVQAVFDARCANQPACHGVAPTPQVSLDLRPGGSAGIIGQQAVQSPSQLLVELGNVDNSYLALKMIQEMPVSGVRMPQGANFEDPAVQADIALVVGWIGGAQLGGCAGGSGSETIGGTDPTTTATTATESESGPPPIMNCGLEDLDPGATNPLVAGDAAMQIPTEIGEILTANCGCHLTEMQVLPGNIPAYPAAGPFQMDTWEEWQGDYSMTTTMIAAAQMRVDPENPMLMMYPTLIMPQTAYCHVGDGETMPPDDRARLVEWLTAGAPDGASWPP